MILLLFGYIWNNVEAKEDLVQKPEEIDKNRKLSGLEKPENCRSFFEWQLVKGFFFVDDLLAIAYKIIQNSNHKCTYNYLEVGVDCEEWGHSSLETPSFRHNKKSKYQCQNNCSGLQDSASSHQKGD